jgi:hypothetical protein
MNKQDIDFLQDTLNFIINTDKTIIGSATTIKESAKGKEESAVVTGINTMHSAIELFNKLPKIGIGASLIDVLSTEWDSDKTTTLDKITTIIGATGSILAITNPISALAIGTFTVGLSLYALASGDDEQISQAVDKMLLTVGEAIGDTWSDATKLLDFATNEANTLADKLLSLSDQLLTEGSELLESLQDSFLETFLNGTTTTNLPYNTSLNNQELTALQTQINQSTNQAADFVAVRRDPLAFDLDNNGIELTQTGALFDHNNNGVKHQTTWLSGDDAWLALDKNNNGTIDNGSELFGDSTIKQDGTTAKDGIDALKDLDSNNDGKIDNQDAEFNNLKLWQDTNQDGISQTAELKTLSELGIESINLTRTGKNQDMNGAIQKAA